MDLARSVAAVLPAVRHVGFGPAVRRTRYGRDLVQRPASDWSKVTARPVEGAVQMEKLDLDTADGFEEILMDGLRIQPAQ